MLKTDVFIRDQKQKIPTVQYLLAPFTKLNMLLLQSYYSPLTQAECQDLIDSFLPFRFHAMTRCWKTKPTYQREVDKGKSKVPLFDKS